jgi:3-hydroxyacyl-[acyl-carrier-protein] dehydratase
MTVLRADQLIEQLPHKPPFLFLSEVLEIQNGTRGEARWDIRGDEDFFKGHFPDTPIVPGVLIAESLAQLSGLVVFADPANEVRQAVLARCDVRFERQVAPPASLVLTSELTRSLGPLHLFDVCAFNDSVRVARGSLALSATEHSE